MAPAAAREAGALRLAPAAGLARSTWWEQHECCSAITPGCWEGEGGGERKGGEGKKGEKGFRQGREEEGMGKELVNEGGKVQVDQDPGSPRKTKAFQHSN